MGRLSGQVRRFLKAQPHDPVLETPLEPPILSYQLLEADQIRLLLLFPSLKGDAVRCRLITTWHRPEISYEALSYVWGLLEPRANIHVNGIISPIRENLYQALKMLRDTKSTRILWIDALCINQSEVRERNHQVARMHEIYRSAKKVLIWLGVPGNDSDICFDRLNQIKGEDIAQDKFLLEFIDGQILSALYVLFHRPYWSRVWIIQEVLCASEIELLCGSKCLPWPKNNNPLEVLIRAKNEQIAKSAPLKKIAKVIMGTPGAIILRERSYFKTQSWLMLLSLCSRCKSQCSDIRDRVYGLIGLVGEYHSFKITPDYTKNVFQLYVDLLFGLLGTLDFRNGRNMDHLLSFTDTMQKLLGDPLFDTNAGVFHALGKTSKLIPYGPLCDSVAFRTFEICALYKIKITAQFGLQTSGDPGNDNESLQRSILYCMDERTLERMKTIGTQYVWGELGASPSEAKAWRPVRHGEPLIQLDKSMERGKCSIVTANNSWVVTSHECQPGDIICSVGSWGQLLVVIRLVKDVPSFILIGRVSLLPGWLHQRRGMSLVPDPPVLKEVSVLEGWGLDGICHCGLDEMALFQLTR